MSWLQKLLPPKIQRTGAGSRIIQEIEAGAADQAVSRVKAFLKPIREALDT